jgi:hypothetical protein
MRNTRFQFVILFGLLGVSGSLLRGAAFQNLDFEQALVVPLSGDDLVPFDAFNPISSGLGLPSWTVEENSTVCDVIWGEPVALDETSVALIDSIPSPEFPVLPDQPLQGKFSVLMSSFDEDIEDFFQTASISQMGTVPAGTKSIQFLVGVPPDNGSVAANPIVSLNGVVIPLVTESVSGRTALMAGNISSFAGSTVDLKFTAAAEENATFPFDEDAFDLDAISFSTVGVVPEVNGGILLGVAGVGLLFVRRRVAVR